MLYIVEFLDSASFVRGYQRTQTDVSKESLHHQLTRGNGV